MNGRVRRPPAGVESDATTGPRCSQRVVGVDWGTRRIGIAVSNSERTLATPWSVVERTGRAEEDRRVVLAVVEEVAARALVVGLPLSLDGRPGPAARSVVAEVEAFAAVLAPRGVVVTTIDERFTTVSAHQAMARAGKRSTSRRRTVDSAAATILLQSWLDAECRRPTIPPG